MTTQSKFPAFAMAVAVAAMMTFIASAADAAVHRGGSTHKHHPWHGQGSSHNPIIHHPRHGLGSSHNPIVASRCKHGYKCSR